MRFATAVIAFVLAASLGGPPSGCARVVIAFVRPATLGGPAAAGKGGGCGSAGKTVIKGSAARVYEQSSHVYACWLGHGRRVRLDMAHSRWRLANVKGRYVAVAFDRARSPAALVWVKLSS